MDDQQSNLESKTPPPATLSLAHPINTLSPEISWSIGEKEVLRVSAEGFFVEGRKATDDSEVYWSFKRWLERAWRSPERLTKLLSEARQVLTDTRDVRAPELITAIDNALKDLKSTS